MAKLYVVATPIGNLSDISPRMRECLAECDVIFAEDTRVTMKLTHVLGISKPLYSCHRHNEEARADWGVTRIIEGDLTAAITCDAGTPGISDPGCAFINAAWQAGVKIVPVSGPSAVTTAISVSGFDAREFAFYGFPPRERKALDSKLNSMLLSGAGVCVMYESPHRVLNLLERVLAVMPECRACVCCDLTKRFESIYRGDIASVLAAVAANPNREKGEYCVVLDVQNVQKPEPPSVKRRADSLILEAMLDGMTLEQALIKAAESGASRNEIYKAKLSVCALLNGECVCENG